MHCVVVCLVTDFYVCVFLFLCVCVCVCCVCVVLCCVVVAWLLCACYRKNSFIHAPIKNETQISRSSSFVCVSHFFTVSVLYTFDFSTTNQLTQFYFFPSRPPFLIVQWKMHPFSVRLVQHPGILSKHRAVLAKKKSTGQNTKRKRTSKHGI